MATKKPAKAKKEEIEVVTEEAVKKPAKAQKQPAVRKERNYVTPKPIKKSFTKEKPPLSAKAIGRAASKPLPENTVVKSITFAELQAKMKLQTLPSAFSFKK